MGDNAPSAEQVANLEKEQREAELQAEFAEFERQEKERNRKQKEYDEQRAQIERDYASQKRTKYAECAVKGASGYLDNAPSRSTGMGGRKYSGKSAPRTSTKRKAPARGFSTGIQSDVQFPSFGGSIRENKTGPARAPQAKSFGTSSPSVGVEMPKRKGIPATRTSKPGFPSGLAHGTSMFSSKVTKSEGIKLGIESPFGSKKTSSLKTGTKKKSLW